MKSLIVGMELSLGTHIKRGVAMNEFELVFNERSAELFCKILLHMAYGKNREGEITFSTDLVDAICKEKGYPCYRFAFNLEKHEYWRMRTPNITLEYLVTSSEKKNASNAYVHQIFNNGQLVYKRPDVPEWTIYAQYNTEKA